MRLRFQIHEPYLVWHTLVRCDDRHFIPGRDKTTVVAFQDHAWSRDADAYAFLLGRDPPRWLLDGRPAVEVARALDGLMEDVRRDATYRVILDETVDGMHQVQAEWEANLDQSTALMRDMTGLALDGALDVLLTHPSQKNGCQVDGRICWAWRLDFPCYNTVFLWHEILHTVLPGGDLDHAVIQLLADNELRVRLNGGSYPPFEGHPHLEPLQVRLLEPWRSYLAQPQRDIREFVASHQGLAT